MRKKIQTIGGYNSYDENYEYSLSICFGDGPLMNLEYLTKEDIYEIASCTLHMLPEEDYRTLISNKTDIN